MPRAASTASRSTPSTPTIRVGQDRAGRRARRARPCCSRSRCPSTVRNTPISTRLGSARPTIDAPIASPEPRCRWPSSDPERQRDQRARSRARRPRARAARAPSSRSKPGWSPMKRERVDERVRAGTRRDHASLPRPGRRAPAERRRAARRRRARARRRGSAGRVDLRLERRRLLEREEDRIAEPVRAAGTRRSSRSRPSRRRRSRRPPMIAGTASGSSTRDEDLAARQAHAARRLEHLRRRARSPATMFGKRITSV